MIGTDLMGRLMATTAVCFTVAFALAQGAAPAAQPWPPLTVHRAWSLTVAGARQVAKRAAAGGRVPEGADSDAVQPASACARRSRLQIDCPFAYYVGFTTAENYERCLDTARVTEIADGRFRFVALTPRCRLINNETP